MHAPRERNAKVLITEEGVLELDHYLWDEASATRFLTQECKLAPDEAAEVSRSMAQALNHLDVGTLTATMIGELLRDRLSLHPQAHLSPLPPVHTLFARRRLVLSDNARTVLSRRYLRKDADGRVIESAEEMFQRVARHIAAAERNYNGNAAEAAVEQLFFELMTSFRFLPNSPTLMNAGRRLGQLAACFVLPIEDSMDGIFDALKNAAIIHKSGGGTGFSFSRLRPKNSMVGTTGGIASGPVSFMRIFNTATEQVKQGGTRRGANMAILRVDHPDILEFIHCKKNNGDLNNFNISVGLTEQFMEAVRSASNYALVDPRTGKQTETLAAVEVYDALVRQAWENGDPGIIFLDRLNRDNPTPSLGEIESTNPCGEQPLLPMEACNLGSINLASFVQPGNPPAVDWEALDQAVWAAVRFLDNTIDMSRYPLAEIDRMVKGNRKIGLGVMGFADLLYQLGIAYNSPQALETAEALMGFIQESSHAASRSLAQVRGVFPNHGISVFKDRPECAFRNATTTTIAPTGTLSIIAGCSSGIEPLFALSFVRTVMDDDRMLEVNPHFERVARERGFYSPELMDRIAASGTIQSMEEIPEDVRRIFVTAHDVAPEWHIRMQAAFQKHTDNAVSKTVNLPRDATVEDVREIYDLAYELGCKGVTIYRDGSKEHQVLSIAAKEQGRKEITGWVKDRPETLFGFTSKIKTGLGQLYITVTEFEGQPFEVFATIGKSGRSTTAKTEAIGRLVSLALRSGVKVDKIVEQLKGIGGEHPIFQNGGLVLSIPDAIARVLERRYMKHEDQPRPGGGLMGERCPECSQTISFEEGCMICHFCGYTKCG
jgi:ribonucleoside-diphosphate reductase alpha chain